jgi:hypothetical protein
MLRVDTGIFRPTEWRPWALAAQPPLGAPARFVSGNLACTHDWAE